MPTPIDLLLDPVAQVILALYAGIFLWERLIPARTLPRVRWWQVRGLTAFALYFLLSSYLPLLWDRHLARWQLADLSALGTWGGALVGLVLMELAIYAWHRAMHRHDGLWRALHQMHHSAERIDAASAFWFSPLDMIGWTLLSSLTLVLLVGLAPEASTLVMLATTFLAMFQHANIRTPRWLGRVIQRPEQHRLHHGRGVHAYNYCDIAAIDMLFGSWRNPADVAGPTGFHDGASARVIDMLRWRDVSTPAGPPAFDAALRPLGIRPD